MTKTHNFIVAAVLFVAIVGVGAGIWMARYEPISVTLYDTGPVTPLGGRGCTPQDGSQDPICKVETGDEFFVGGDIKNDSPFTVDLLPPVNPGYGIVKVERYLGVPCDRRIHTPDQCAQARPFPVHIAPHSTEYVAVVYRIVGLCDRPKPNSSDTSFGLNGPRMRFHFVGGTRTVIAPWPGSGDSGTYRFVGGCSGTEGVKLG